MYRARRAAKVICAWCNTCIEREEQQKSSARGVMQAGVITGATKRVIKAVIKGHALNPQIHLPIPFTFFAVISIIFQGDKASTRVTGVLHK